MSSAILPGLFLTACLLALILFYRRHYWRNARARPLLWWTVGILAPLVAAKYLIWHSGRGYVQDRWILYARATPALDGLPYIAVVVLALAALVFWYRRKHACATWLRLSLLALIFAAFAAGIASLRDGVSGIALPFERTQWEYAGDAQLISTVPEFLHDYVSLYPQLSLHGKEHPPGNALVIHYLKRAFGADAAGITPLIILIGATLVFPVYFFWRQYLPKPDVENMMPVFMLTPSIVMFSATSMDIVSPPVFWSALLLCDVGWKRGWLTAFMGGLIGGFALLLNFLFLAFGLVLVFLFIRRFPTVEPGERPRLLGRGIAAVAGLVLFFVGLYLLTGYSIVENFLHAFSVHHSVVQAGASSMAVYLVFAAINLIAFLLYLGIVHVVLFVREGAAAFRFSADKDLLMAGFAMIGVFIMSGVFQGEIERIWLFLTPLFIPAMVQTAKRGNVPAGAVISLLVFQIMVQETLFYTYW